MQIRTNNVPRPIVSGCELDGKHRKQAASDYDFLGSDFDNARFIVYRNHVHYLGNFSFAGAPDGWTGLEVDGYSSGTVIRLVDDGEAAVMGYATSGSPDK